MMPLTLVEPGKHRCVKTVEGKPEVKQHLENLGFVPGAHVMVIAQRAGNVIVRIRESRVAISREMAGRIMV